MEIWVLFPYHEDKLLYDISDHVYIYVNIIIPNGKPKFENRKVV